MQNELPRRLDLRRHVGKAEGDGLMLDDRLAEGDALAGIVACRLEGRPRHADRLRGDADPAAFEIGKRDPVAFALLAEPAGRPGCACR